MRPGIGQERLRAAASFVPRGARVADIGTDHGILPRLLLDSGHASHCIATDRDPRAVSRLGQLARGRTWADRLEVRHGDGLGVLGPGDYLEVVILTGLGARTVVRVIENGRRIGRLPRRLILQPQTEPARVRAWLRRHGLTVVAEELVRERGRFYVVLAAESREVADADGHPDLTPEDLLEAGPCLVRNPTPLVREFWRRDLERQRHILRTAARGPGRDVAVARRDRARRVLATLETG